MKTLNVIKIGGNIIDDEVQLNHFIASISTLNEPFILIHGGGKLATDLAVQLNIPQQLIDGRRITNAKTLKIATMVYAGYINKTIVALLQKNNTNSIGLSGTDGNLIEAKKRNDDGIDYGFVGDISKESINVSFLNSILNLGLTPVICAITHDKKGQLLNTNADTIVNVIATSLAHLYEVKLMYCFEKKGVLLNSEDENSVIESLNFETFQDLKSRGIINKGMIPKLENCYQALANGVKEIGIIKAQNCVNFITKNNHGGTRIK
jgi:acetylglutamate kinase